MSAWYKWNQWQKVFWNKPETLTNRYVMESVCSKLNAIDREIIQFLARLKFECHWHNIKIPAGPPENAYNIYFFALLSSLENWMWIKSQEEKLKTIGAFHLWDSEPILNWTRSVIVKNIVMLLKGSPFHQRAGVKKNGFSLKKTAFFHITEWTVAVGCGLNNMTSLL